MKTKNKENMMNRIKNIFW